MKNKKVLLILGIVLLLIIVIGSILIFSNQPEKIVETPPVVEVQPEEPPKTEVVEKIEEIVPGEEEPETTTDEVIDLTKPDEYKYFDLIFPEEFGDTSYGLVRFEDGVEVENIENYSELEITTKRPGINLKMKYYTKEEFDVVDIVADVRAKKKVREDEIKADSKLGYSPDYSFFERTTDNLSASYDINYLNREDGLLRRSIYSIETIDNYVLELECQIDYSQLEETELNNIVAEIQKAVYVPEFIPSDWKIPLK